MFTINLPAKEKKLVVDKVKNGTCFAPKRLTEFVVKMKDMS